VTYRRDAALPSSVVKVTATAREPVFSIALISPAGDAVATTLFSPDVAYGILSVPLPGLPAPSV
jgi:hypothetical protein